MTKPLLKLLAFGLPCLFISQELKAQSTENPVKVEVHGFVNYEMMYDTRQATTSREGEVMIFPSPVDRDVNGVDKNAQGQLNMITFHSRLQVAATGPKIGVFNSSSVIEADFLGSASGYENMVRLRHAFFKLSSEKSEWLLGQYWHPMFVPECFPEVVAWNVGLPIHTLSRNPQIRYTYKPNAKLKVTLAALSQRDFASSGPVDDLGKKENARFIQRSGMPDLQAQIMIKPSDVYLFGATAGYKTIAPRLVTATGLSHKETIGSYNLNVFSRLKAGNSTWLLEFIQGENLSHLTLLGGYAVKSSVDPINLDYRSYTNIRSMMIWTDYAYQIKKVRVGIFAGYAKNQGGKDDVNFRDGNNKIVTYGLGTNIDHLISITPRVVYVENKLKFGFELNHLEAAYGTIQNDLTVSNTTKATNNRFLFSASYSF